jgi:hypothetical protein
MQTKALQMDKADALSHLSGWSQQHFGVSFGSERVARELRSNEVDAEIAGVIRAIGSEAPLPLP